MVDGGAKPENARTNVPYPHFGTLNATLIIRIIRVDRSGRRSRAWKFLVPFVSRLWRAKSRAVRQIGVRYSIYPPESALFAVSRHLGVCRRNEWSSLCFDLERVSNGKGSSKTAGPRQTSAVPVSALHRVLSAVLEGI
jgi:hypothetical protein